MRPDPSLMSETARLRRKGLKPVLRRRCQNNPGELPRSLLRVDDNAFQVLLLLIPLPYLEDVATPGMGTEVGGAWFTGRCETHLITVRIERVHTEHHFFG